MELVLVRHALPLRSDDGADPGLAPRGVEQARRVAEVLAAERVDALVTSPLRRAAETAAPIATALDLPPAVEEGLAEFDSGDGSYVPIEELKAAGDPRWEALKRGDLYSVGVDPVAFRHRVLRAAVSVAEAHPGGRAVLVTHAGVINALAGDVLGQSRPIWFAPAYVSISRIAVARDGRRGVVSLNESGHARDLF